MNFIYLPKVTHRRAEMAIWLNLEEVVTVEDTGFSIDIWPKHDIGPIDVRDPETMKIVRTAMTAIAINPPTLPISPRHRYQPSPPRPPLY